MEINVNELDYMELKEAKMVIDKKLDEEIESYCEKIKVEFQNILDNYYREKNIAFVIYEYDRYYTVKFFITYDELCGSFLDKIKSKIGEYYIKEVKKAEHDNEVNRITICFDEDDLNI